MGIKAFKEKFGIEHIVCKTQKGICIGSSYIHDLAVINPETGSLFVNHDFQYIFANNYQELVNAKDSERLDALNICDVFTESLPVYAFIDGEIVEKFCEQYDWPNITHDGLLMYENVFFKNKTDAINNAIQNQKRSIENAKQRIKDYQIMIDEANRQIINDKAILQKLKNISI